jgi:hypothetical protein
MSIQFKCPQCRAGITAPDVYAGRAAKCPKCKEPVSVPAGTVPLVQNSQTMMVPRVLPKLQNAVPRQKSLTLPAKMQCPYCREEIRGDARKCRHCGEDLNRALHSPVNNYADSQILTIAKAQEGMLWSLLILTVGFGMFGVLTGTAEGAPDYIPVSVIWLLLLVWFLLSDWFIYSTCSLLWRLKAGMPLLWLLGMNVPILGLILILTLSSRASNVVRDAGFRVGFMGADVPGIEAHLDCCLMRQSVGIGIPEHL